MSVCCKGCKFVYERGGLWFCLCPLSDYYDMSVSLDFQKLCDYRKEN